MVGARGREREKERESASASVESLSLVSVEAQGSALANPLAFSQFKASLCHATSEEQEAQDRTHKC